MNARLTRRTLGAGLLSLIPLPAVSALRDGEAEVQTIHQLIRAHRAALVAERLAVTDYNRAVRWGSPAAAALKAKRDELRKARHSARRNLRRATPQNGEELAALADYYAGLIPSPDPQDVAGTGRRDLDAARGRMGRAS